MDQRMIIMNNMLNTFDNIPKRSVEKVDAAIEIIAYAIDSYFFNSLRFKKTVIYKIIEIRDLVTQIGLDEGAVINYQSDLDFLIANALELQI